MKELQAEDSVSLLIELFVRLVKPLLALGRLLLPVVDLPCVQDA